MSKWITDRLPEMHEQTSEGEVWVFDEYKEYVIRNYQDIILGTPWCEIEPPEAYVAPKSDPKYFVMKDMFYKGLWAVYDGGKYVTGRMPTQEAAERFAALYNEVMP